MIIRLANIKSLLEVLKYISYLLIFICIKAHSVNDNYPSGARASALSNSGVVLEDLWSNYHNQAGLAGVDKLTLGFHYENKYVVSQYGLHALALAIPTNRGTIGASVTFFGYSKYNESKISLAFGKPFGDKFSAGIQLDLLNIYQAEDYGNSTTLAVEAGILAEPVDGLFIGAHVYNPTKSYYHTFEPEKVPTIFQVGIGYYFTEKLLIVMETEKDLEQKIVFQGGAEYHVIKSIYARVGLSTFELSSYSFGVGFVYKGIKADMAFSHHQILGYTPHVSFSYSFR
ncbi:MAG: hypothetical protein JSV22_06095 [Bacteroidales bacterium]|nr:MAG: hypothetical protein JSV22_06095 [Bacteroidales bacterium]